MKLRRLFLLSFFSVFFASSAVSQDLKDELDALEDYPEADLTEPGGGARSGGDELSDDDLGDSLDEVDSDDLLKKDEVPADDLDLDGDDELDSLSDDKKSTQEGSLPDDDLGLDDSVGLENEVDAISPNKDRPRAQDTMTGVEVEAAARIVNLTFQQMDDRVRAIVSSDRPLDYSKENRVQRKQVIVEIRNTALASSFLKRAIDTGEFDGPVALIQAYESKTSTMRSAKILFQLRSMTEPKITRSGNSLYIDFPINAGATLFKSSNSSKTQVQIPETFLTLDAKARFVGSRISITLKNADLADALKLISGYSNKNFILSGGATGSVTLSVKNTPWDQVLAIMLANNQLGYQKVGDIYRIAPVATLKTEIADAVKIAKDAEVLIPLETRLIPVNYAKATEILTNINDFKSEGRGKISVDTRTNSLVVTDVPEVLEKIVSYVRQVDRQTAVVQIEARIVEATQDFKREFQQAFNIGPATGGRFEGSFFSTNTASAANRIGGFSVRSTLGDLGAIDAFLGLTESESTTKLVSSPRVSVLDNRQASITSGRTIKFPAVAAGGSTIDGGTSKQELRLAVTPSVTSDGFVLLDIDLTNDTDGGSDVSQVVTNTRNAKTNLLVESGKTAMVGGVYLDDNLVNESGLPLLRGIPVLGALFRTSATRTNNTRELVMFIQPKIVNSNKIFMSYKEDLLGPESSKKKAKVDSKSDFDMSDDDGLDDL